MKASVVTAPGEKVGTDIYFDVVEALKTATTHGAADKVVVTFN